MGLYNEKGNPIRHGHCANYKHSKTYSVWRAMIDRCNYPTSVAYSRYGGRGIKVCERWSKFENFLKDMGEVKKGMTIDRINNDGNYEPGNCRWATMQQQQRNRCDTRFITYRGETKPAIEWAEILGVDKKLVKARLDHGWDGVRAITEPKRIS